jgi:hypothetical protein
MLSLSLCLISFNQCLLFHYVQLLTPPRDIFSAIQFSQSPLIVHENNHLIDCGIRISNYEVDELKEINPYNLGALNVSSLTVWMNSDEPVVN